MLLTAFYMLGASLAFLLQRARQYFGVALAMLAVLASTITTSYLAYPKLVLGVLGSDVTLTGRTELWALVLHLIWQKPLLGWGYSAMWLPSDAITQAISDAVGWDVPQAHNALLEVTLELGLAGLVIVMSFVAISFWRAVRCLISGRYKLGMFSLVFFLGILISGTTESTLAQNQTIEWVIFSVLSFCCGLEIMGRQVSKETPSSPYNSNPRPLASRKLA
jgi:O-antigen ligase